MSDLAPSRCILVNNFKSFTFLNFRLIDVALNRPHNFPLSRLPANIHRFEAIISGNRTRISEEEITVDQEAAKLMANLYLELESHGFEGHETSVFLIRILFLLFGDDTGMWAKKSFLKLVMETKEDGSNVGSQLDILFDLLNTPSEKRSKTLSDSFNAFPYVNGGIFAENTPAINAYLKAGWFVEGIQKDHFVRNGKTIDRVLVACFNPKFLSAS